MKSKRIVFVGLGAVGCSYAAAFRQAGLKVSVLAGGARAERLRQGILLNGKERLYFDLAAPGEKISADLVVFATKFHQLKSAIADARACVSENTVLLSLLNGVGAEELIKEAFPQNTVLYGRVAGLTANRYADRLERGTLGAWRVGLAKNDPEALDEAVKTVLALCETAGIPAAAPEDMLHAVWWKLMCNVGLNQCSAVLGADYGVFQRIGEARDMMRAAMEEVLLVAPAAGVRLLPEEMEEYLALVDKMEPWGKTSMLQDVEAGRPTEVDVLAGSVLKYAEKLGVSVPVNAFLYRHIRVIERLAKEKRS